MCCKKRPNRVVDHLRDTLLGWGRCHLVDKGQKQRSLAHEYELRGRELTIVDHEFLLLDAPIELFGEAVDGFLYHNFVIAAANFRHTLGDREDHACC
jgi:hypothetical protein